LKLTPQSQQKRSSRHSLVETEETLQKILPEIKPADHSMWLDDVRVLKGDCAVRDINNLPDNGHLYAAHVINALWKVTKGEAIIPSDVGQNQMWAAQYIVTTIPIHRSHLVD
jgi:acetolactate synthase-1/2/3 large subunit